MFSPHIWNFIPISGVPPLPQIPRHQDRLPSRPCCRDGQKFPRSLLQGCSGFSSEVTCLHQEGKWHTQTDRHTHTWRLGRVTWG